MIKEKDSLVLLVGRPNVGKSTIFNKILGGSHAVSSRNAGTTLDLNIKKINHNSKWFLVSDSGGFNISPNGGLEKKIREKVFAYAKKARLILLVVDYKAGLIPEDREIYLKFLKINPSVMLIINKVDSLKNENDAYAVFSRLGIKKQIAVSAENGTGINELLDIVSNEFFPSPSRADFKEEKNINISIVGKSNSGKSTYVNTILKEDLIFVSDKPGTTRDSIDTYIKYRGYGITLTDTAGIRKKSRLDESSEGFQRQSLNQIKKGDVIIIFIDISQGITHEDLSLIKMVMIEKKPFIIAFTKWDKRPEAAEAKRLEKEIKWGLKEFGDYPRIFISSKTNKNLYKLLDKSVELYNSKFIKVKTKEINKFIADYKNDEKWGRLFKFITYGVQKEGENIPTFIFFLNNKRKIIGTPDIKRLRGAIKEYFSIKSGVEVLVEYK